MYVFIEREFVSLLQGKQVRNVFKMTVRILECDFSPNISVSILDLICILIVYYQSGEFNWCKTKILKIQLLNTLRRNDGKVLLIQNNRSKNM